MPKWSFWSSSTPKEAPAQATPIATYRGSAPVANQRGWNLALAFQEVLTAIVRVRFGRQTVANADSFRAHIKESLRVAAQDALNAGYTQEDVQLALYAVVAFVDESVLNSHQPVFADWPRLPLQEELFGGHIAGESFFDNLQRLLGRTDFVQAADLLEVFYICVLLGYRGRYAITRAGELGGIMNAVRDKIERIRGAGQGLSPRWALPAEAVPTGNFDPWTRRLAQIALAALGFATLLFIGYKLGLMSGASELRALANQVRW